MISATCWYLPGKIGEMDVDFLVDSGSTYTIVDIGLFQSIPQACRPELEFTDLRLRSANGEILKVHGKTVMNLQIGGKTFEVPVKVVSLGEKDVILGLDFMSYHDCVLYLSHGILQVGSKSLRVKLHKQSDNLCARIQVSENVNIPPLHEMIVCGKISNRRKTFQSEIGTVEELDTLSAATGLQVARALVDAKQENVPVRIANFTTDVVKLNKGQTVALLQPVDKEQIKEVENLKDESSSVPGGHIAHIHIEEDEDVVLPTHLQSLLNAVSPEITDPEKHKIAKLLHKYQSCFVGEDGVLGKTTLVKHRIDTHNAAPVKQ